MRSFFAAMVLAILICVPANAAEKCIASIYTTKDKDQNGTKTASGIPLNDKVATIARPNRKWLRSHAVVTNLRNGRTEAFRVTDVGPHVPGRCVDLSRAAAIILGCNGLCPVRVQ